MQWRLLERRENDTVAQKRTAELEDDARQKEFNGRRFDGSTLSFVQFLQQNCENSTRLSSVLLGNIATFAL